MRKISAYAAILLFITATLSSQDIYGVKGGLGSSYFTGGDWDDYLNFNDWDNEVSLSGTFGVFASLQLSNVLYLQPELLFSFKHFQYGDGSDYIREKYTLADIPIYFKFTTNRKEGGNRFYFMAGPQFSYLFGNVDIEYSNRSDESVSIDEFVDNSLLLGLAAGVGYEIAIDSGFLSFGVKYSRDFTGIWDNYDAFMNNLLFEVGFGFGD